MAQQFPTSAQVIYDILVADPTFSGLIGTYTFKAGQTSPAISIVTPGTDIPSLRKVRGVECVIQDTGDFTKNEAASRETKNVGSMMVDQRQRGFPLLPSVLGDVTAAVELQKSAGQLTTAIGDMATTNKDSLLTMASESKAAIQGRTTAMASIPTAGVQEPPPENENKRPPRGGAGGVKGGKKNICPMFN